MGATIVSHIGKINVSSDILVLGFELFGTSEVLRNFGKSLEVSEVAPKLDFEIFSDQNIFSGCVKLS